MRNLLTIPSPTAGRVRFGGMQTPAGYLFELGGGRLCLDFANTLDERLKDRPRELIPRYEDLLSWGTQAGALSAADARRLCDHATNHPMAAAKAMRRARELREAIFEILSAAAAQRTLPAAAISLLAAFIPAVMNCRRLVPAGAALAWDWRQARPCDLDRVVWPVVLSAAELLTGMDLRRIRQCAGAGCAWLFMDTSKNRTRRWCDMSVCGNRAKARRHQVRVRSHVRKSR